MLNKRFAVFVLTHGRAKTISTIDALLRQGYTGDYYVVIDNEDNDEQLYREKFGDHIIQFNKKEYADKLDSGDLDTDRRIGVLARNFIQDEAKRLGYKYHLQLDDDIISFLLRCERDGSLRAITTKNIDKAFDALLEYMDECDFTSLSLGSGQYCLGGVSSNNWKKGMIPKTMTTFFMRADKIRYFKFRMNDDITTSCLNNMVGDMYYTIMQFQQRNRYTQSESGGMTEIYRDNGTYRKSFYTVMAIPSASKISVEGVKNLRIHHNINFDNVVPRIISDKYRKKKEVHDERIS